jgi:hypothetical protein
VRGDPLLLLSKQATNGEQTIKSVWIVAEKLRREASLTCDPAEQTASRLYSRLVTHYLAHHQQVPLDAHSFYQWHAEQPLLEYTAVART